MSTTVRLAEQETGRPRIRWKNTKTKGDPVGYLYQLSFPSGKSYFGIARSFRRRFREHLREAQNGSSYPIHCAVRKYGRERIVGRVLVAARKSYLKELEIRAIAKFNSLHPAGYNLHEGGNTPPSVKGRKQSTQHRIRIGRALRQRHLENRKEEHRRRSQIALRWYAKPETRALRRRMHDSPGWRARNKAANLGKKRSPEVCANISAALKGREILPEWRKKISKSLTGYRHTEETRRKQSLSHKRERNHMFGKRHSPEAIERMRMSHRLERAARRRFELHGGL